jgi:hypothetical protein
MIVQQGIRLVAHARLGVLGVFICALVSGCGGSPSGTLYMLFDASESSSELVREGYKDDAILIGLSYCRSHRGSGVVLNVITATPEQDSIFETLRCPKGKNETDQRAQEIVFRAQLSTRVQDVIQVQSSSPGSDVIGAVSYAAEQTFHRFPTDHRFLVIFSDMQQSGGGVRNCIKGASYGRASRCVSDYYKRNPDVSAKPQLDSVATYVIGFAKTIRGSIDSGERRNYESFWRTYFNRQGATLCWFAASNLPVLTNADGSKIIDPKYFTSDCPPV